MTKSKLYPRYERTCYEGFIEKGLIIGAAGSAICVLWHHLLTKKMMQLAMDRVAPQDRSNGKCVCPVHLK